FGELAQPLSLSLSSEDSIWKGLEEMEAAGVRETPVIDSEERGALIGTVAMPDLMAAYRNAVEQGRKVT
ncbi:MAG: hypothetical protein AAGC68_15130, partial [Verrucomicrobiota bacterium]